MLEYLPKESLPEASQSFKLVVAASGGVTGMPKLRIRRRCCPFAVSGRRVQSALEGMQRGSCFDN